MILKDRLITWDEAVKKSDELREIIEREHGRIALYIHTGGGCFGRFEEGQYHHPISERADIYLGNIITALSRETGIAILLGAYYEGINEVQTEATIIDLPSIPDVPIPWVDDINVGDYNPFAPKRDFAPWDPVIEEFKQWGVTDLSPYGGEVAALNEETKVVGKCVLGALLKLKQHFNVTVYPQLCCADHKNPHLIQGNPISTGRYTLGPDIEQTESHLLQNRNTKQT